MTSYGIWVVVVAGATAACGSRAVKPDTSAEQVALRKLDAYMQCHLDHSSLVFRTEDLYRQHVSDVPPGPGSVVVVVPTPDPAACIGTISAAKALQPPMPELDAAASAYATELARAHRLTSTYDPAKAAELHAELLSAFEAFDRAQATLFDQLYAVNRTMHLKQLGQREKKD